MDYKKLAEQRTRSNPFALFVGINITKIEEGYAEVELKLRPEHLNPVGIVHGGCLYTMADVVTGAACASLGTQAVTVSGEYHYLAPAPANMKVATAAAKCIKSGKTICVFDVEVFAEDRTVIGKGTFTVFRLVNKPIVIE